MQHLLHVLLRLPAQVGPRLLGVLLEDVPPASLMQLSGTPAQAAALLTAVVTIRTDVDNNNPSYRTVPSRSGSSRHGGSQGGAGDVNATPSTSSVDGVSGRGTSATTTVPLSSEVQPDEESSTTFILYPPPKPSNAEETGVIAVSGLELALEPETGGASHQPSPQHSASTTPPGVSTLRTHQPPPQHSITTQVTGGSGSQAHTGGQHRHATSQRLSAWVQSSLVTLAPVAGTSALPVASLLALLRSLIRTRTRVPDAFMRSLYASTAQLSPQGSAAQHTGPGVGSGSAEALDSATDSTEPAQSNGGDAAGGRQQVALGMLSPSQLQQLLWAVSQLVTAGPGALPPPLEWLKVRLSAVLPEQRYSPGNHACMLGVCRREDHVAHDLLGHDTQIPLHNMHQLPNSALHGEYLLCTCPAPRMLGGCRREGRGTTSYGLLLAQGST
jgi:hypothetical protein